MNKHILVTDEECRKHPVYEDNSIMKDYICVVKSDKTGCEKRQLCTSISFLRYYQKCDNFPPSDIKKICSENTGGNKPCKEVFLCDKADSGKSDKECMNYFTNVGYICLKNTNSSDSPCKEVHTCNYASKDDGKDLTAEVCSGYPISFDNKDTYICLYNKDEGKCYEEFLCEKVNLNPKGDKNCSDYPVKKGNEQTHICISNDEKENTCKEIEKCSGMGTKKDITDEECRKHPVYEDNLIMKDYICVAKSDKTGCEKKQLCTSISSLKDGEKCDNFAPSDIKKTCIADGNNKCKEEFLCEKADSGDSDEQCMNYIVSDESKFICLKNTEKSGSSLCKENQLCEAVTGDLTDSDCNKYPVTRDNKNTHICVKNTNK